MNFHTAKISVFFAAAALLFNSCAEYGYVRITGYAQGGTYTVQADLGGTKTKPEQLKAHIDSVLTEIDNAVSGYNKSSVLSRFNAGESVERNAIFEELCALGDRYCTVTGGAVDVWSAPLFDVWGFGFTRDSLPSKAVLGAAKILCAQHKEVNFNAIAQGYSSDLISEYLRKIGVRNMLVDIGGEMYAQGVNPSGKNWTIGIDTPEDGNFNPGEKLSSICSLPATPCGIVTSGNYRKFYLKDGKKYAHTIDPRTGYPVTHSLLSATIISKDPASSRNATDADAYATFCMVVGLEEAQRFINSNPHLDAILIYDEGGQMKIWRSDAAAAENQL